MNVRGMKSVRGFARNDIGAEFVRQQDKQVRFTRCFRGTDRRPANGQGGRA
jgi:hypothetical protein